MSKKIVDTIIAGSVAIVPTTASLREVFDAARAAHAQIVESINANPGDQRPQRDEYEKSKSAFRDAFLDLIADLGDDAPVIFNYASTANVAVSYMNQAAYMVALGGSEWWSESKLTVLIEHVNAWKTAEEAFVAAGYKPVDQKVISDAVGVQGVITRKFPAAIYDKMLEKHDAGEQPVFYAPAALAKLEAIRTKLRAPAVTDDVTTTTD